MTDDRPTSEVLNLAADLIEERGWSIGDWSTDGSLCVEGAIAAAMGIKSESGMRCPARDAVGRYLDATPFIWNDQLHHDLTLGLINGGLSDAAAASDLAFEQGGRQVVEVLRATALIEFARERTNGGPRPDLDDLRANLDEPNLRAALAAVSS